MGKKAGKNWRKKDQPWGVNFGDQTTTEQSDTPSEMEASCSTW